MKIVGSGGGGGGGISSQITNNNLLINPRMKINQRAFVGGALTAGDYGYDRWKSADASTSVTQTANTTTLTAGAIKQIVETDIPINGRTVTASLENATGDYVLAILDNAGSVLASSTSASVSHLLTGDEATLSLQITNISGSVTWQSAKLEWGTAATPNLDRLIGAELELCQRYFWTHGGNVSVFLPFLRRSGSADVQIGFAFPSEMRVTPTMSNGGEINVNAVSYVNTTSRYLSIFGSSPATNFNSSVLGVEADAEL